MERIEFRLSWWHHRTLTIESCTNKLWSSLRGGHMLSLSPLHPWPPVPCASLRFRDTACSRRWKCISAKSEETKNVWLQWHVSSICFQEIMVPFNQMPVSRCDLVMPSRATVIQKGPNKRWTQQDTLRDFRSNAKGLLRFKIVNYQQCRQWNVNQQMWICLANHGFNFQFKTSFSTFNTRIHQRGWV